MRTELRCVSGVELVMDYLEGVLSADVSTSLEAHVAGCPRCVAFLDSYRATPPILRRATTTKLPPDVGDSLHAFLRRRRGRPGS
jgi:anti-sigma factor RsiW